MHAFTHILAMNQWLFSLMYGSYTSSTFLPKEQYMSTDIWGRNYIITPSVKKFVQEYFGCNEDNIGGLLE